MNHRVSRELVLFFSLRVVISQQRKYRLAKNWCNSHFNPFIHTIQKPILCSDRHTFSWYYPREFDTKSKNFPWLMFLSSHHLSTWKSIKIINLLKSININEKSSYGRLYYLPFMQLYKPQGYRSRTPLLSRVCHFHNNCCRPKGKSNEPTASRCSSSYWSAYF